MPLMKSKEVRLPIGSVANRLGYLDNTLPVALFAYRHSREVSQLIVGGFSELIDRFNALDPGSTVMEIMPGTKHLKTVLQGTPIPRPLDFSPRDIITGVKEAVPLMEMGQRVKNGGLDENLSVTKEAIGTPSMETSELALAAGTGGHILERTIFNVMRRSGIEHDWTKDEVLHALEETSMLMYAESLKGRGKEPVLFTLISDPNFLGGLGWCKAKRAAKFMQDYAALFS
jgi:hypothetical protein